MILKQLKLTLFFALFLLTSQPTLANKPVTVKYNGLNLNASLKLADGTTLKDGIILITHGTLAHGKMEITTTLQNLFADNGFSTLAITLGLNINNRSGFYDCAIPHTHKHTDAIGEIDAWVKWLKSQGTNNIVLLGHSRGGNQTAWYAAEHDNEMIEKIILVAPQVWSMQSVISDYKDRYKKDLLPLLDKASSYVNSNNAKQLIEHIDFIYCPDSTASAESFVSYYKDDPRKDTPYLINKISKPVLVFVGTEDKVIKNLDKAMQSINRSNVTTTIIEGADHSFRDLYADELIESAIEFIEE